MATSKLYSNLIYCYYSSVAETQQRQKNSRLQDVARNGWQASTCPVGFLLITNTLDSVVTSDVACNLLDGELQSESH